MALNTNPFVEGIDPSATFGGYASVLLQLIRQAQPSSTYGMILFDTATPDVTGANAWRKRCIWIDLTVPGTPTVNVYKEGGSPGWANVQSVIPNDTITTTMIKSYNSSIPNTGVTLPKLSPSGGTANQLIRVNGTATAFEFVSLASLVTAGSILPSAISGVAVAPGTFRLLGNLNGGTTTWYSPTEVAQGIADAGIDVVQIAPSTTAAARSRFITTRTADTTATWRYFDPNVDILTGTMSGDRLTDNTVPVAKIIPSTVEGALLAVVGGVPDWIPAPTVTTKYISTVPAVGSSNIPTVGSRTPVVFAHGLGHIPTTCRVTLYCLQTDANWLAGNEIEITGLLQDDGHSTAMQAFVTQIDATNITIWRPISITAYSASIYAIIKTGPNAANWTSLDTSKWAIKVYATYTT
jgi:hypothetical protein